MPETTGPEADEDVPAECATEEALGQSLECAKKMEVVIDYPDYTVILECDLSEAVINLVEDDDGVAVSVDCVYGECGFSLPPTVAH